MATMATHCPECGFVNPEAANYCQKAEPSLAAARGDEQEPRPTRVETSEIEAVDIDAEVEHTGAQPGHPQRRRTGGRPSRWKRNGWRSGRSPDAGVFLDDVTVSAITRCWFPRPTPIPTISDRSAEPYVNRKRIGPSGSGRRRFGSVNTKLTYLEG